MERLRQSRVRLFWGGVSYATMSGVKRTTAIGRLSDVADGLDRSKQWPGPAVAAAYVYGEFLDLSIEVERVQLALVVDQPAAVVAWMSRPAQLEALAAMLRFDKLPLSWCWRPLEWPVWNHEITGGVCFWTIDGGVDQHALDVLLSGEVGPLMLGPADREQLMDQLRVEREVGWQHLAEVTERFHDSEWRRAHRGDGVYPEDHLWSAAAGYLELQRALEDPPT
ncbi:MAG: hypothetical protein ABI862_14010 [Ilumatobacteraceae bacterium]